MPDALVAVMVIGFSDRNIMIFELTWCATEPHKTDELALQRSFKTE
ncbi:MAG: hypothetical protein HWE23_09175 [Rhodobacteraceae bacterium]|nr:hypothetical protein [Paracoccaceae bacterium]